MKRSRVDSSDVPPFRSDITIPIHLRFALTPQSTAPVSVTARSLIRLLCQGQTSGGANVGVVYPIGSSVRLKRMEFAFSSDDTATFGSLAFVWLSEFAANKEVTSVANNARISKFATSPPPKSFAAQWYNVSSDYLDVALCSIQMTGIIGFLDVWIDYVLGDGQNSSAVTLGAGSPSTVVVGQLYTLALDNTTTGGAYRTPVDLPPVGRNTLG